MPSSPNDHARPAGSSVIEPSSSERMMPSILAELSMDEVILKHKYLRYPIPNPQQKTDPRKEQIQ